MHLQIYEYNFYSRYVSPLSQCHLQSNIKKNRYNFEYILKPKMIDSYMLENNNWTDDKLMQVNLQG